MTTRKNTYAAILATTAIAASSMMLVLTGAPTAFAACQGGASYTSTSGWGYEGPQNLTCDGKNDYNGVFWDPVVDGKRVRIRTRWINGSSSYSYSNLTDGLNKPYYYSYWDNDKSTTYNICRSDGVCAPQGTNWGF